MCILLGGCLASPSFLKLKNTIWQILIIKIEEIKMPDLQSNWSMFQETLENSDALDTPLSTDEPETELEECTSVSGGALSTGADDGGVDLSSFYSNKVWQEEVVNKRTPVQHRNWHNVEK
jgi:hypothetical protein